MPSRLLVSKMSPNLAARIPKNPVFYLDLWNPTQGYNVNHFLRYNGSTAYLINPVADYRSGDSEGAIEVWFRTASASRVLIASGDEGSVFTYYFTFYVNSLGNLQVDQKNNDTTDAVRGLTDVRDNKWHHAVLSSNGSAYSITLDGIAETLAVSGGSNTGDWFADTTLRDNLTIGVLATSSLTNYMNGDIGWVRIYSRPMGAAEALTNYNRGLYASASDTTNLVFNLPLTEGASNPVDTVGALTMTLTGSTTPSWANFENSLGSFDGNDYWSRTVADYRSGDSSGAIEFWTRQPSGLTGYRAAVSSGDTATSNFRFHISTSSGNIGMYAKTGAGVENSVTTASTLVNDDKWHHVVVSSSGTAWDIIIDGVSRSLTASGSNTGDWFADVANRDNLVIGVEIINGTQYYYSGEIGFTRIYSRSMAEAEALANYVRGRKGAPSDTTGLVGSWDFTERSGTTAVDSVGGADLTLTGVTWVEGLVDKSVNVLPVTSFGSPTWGSRGRVFNGTTDLLSGSASLVTALTTLSIGTVLMWVEPSDISLNLRIPISLGDTDADTSIHLCWTRTSAFNGQLAANCVSAAASQWSVGSDNVVYANNAFAFVGVTQNGVEPQLWANGLAIAQTFTVTTDKTKWMNMAGLDNFRIGCRNRLSGGNTDFFPGKIGDVWIFNRALTAQEIQQIYNATRWRYGV